MVGNEAVSTLGPSGIPQAETLSAPCQGNQEKVSLFPSPTLYPPRQQRQRNQELLSGTFKYAGANLCCAEINLLALTHPSDALLRKSTWELD